jgi:hypothetical protein
MKTMKIMKLLAVTLFLLTLHAGAWAGISVGNMTYEKVSGPGGTYQGSFDISCKGREPEEVKIYQTDYLFFSDGSNQYGEPGSTKRSNAGWITYSPKRTVIPPGGKATVNYSVKVPDDKSLAGTYWSMIMVEGIGKGSPESTKPEKDKIKVGLQTVMRYGIQMVTHMGETGTSAMKFLDQKLIDEGGKVTLQVDVENMGERWLRPALWAELYDEEGKHLGKFEGGRTRIFPGTSVRFKLALGDIPQGRYKALVVSDCGGDNVFGGVFQLNLKR